MFISSKAKELKVKDVALPGVCCAGCLVVEISAGGHPEM